MWTRRGPSHPAAEEKSRLLPTVLCRLSAAVRQRPRLTPLCPVDDEGCPVCGRCRFERHRILTDALAASWELSNRERAWFDEREGHQCGSCGSSLRVRALLWTLRRVAPDPRGLRILHLNEIPNVEKILRGASLVQTFFDPPTYPPSGEGGRSVRTDMRRLPFPDCSFDLVIHSDTLEHIVEWREALDEGHRVLCNSGRQVYTVPLLPERRSRPRLARLSDGAVHPLLPASYHGEGEHYLVAWEFGLDFLKSRRPWLRELDYVDRRRNPTVFTAVEAPLGRRRAHART